MQINTVIFDMDGLLIDSEPCWEKAGKAILKEFGYDLTTEQYFTTTGLRSKEWIQYWFNYYKIDMKHAVNAELRLNKIASDLIKNEALPRPGVRYIFNFFREKNFNIAIASSSATALIEAVIEKLNIGTYLTAYASAESLIYGKPHPEVYLNCAGMLKVNPLQCICFEDSVTSMIAAKAARMKCVAVPMPQTLHDKRFGLADLVIASLQDFNEELLDELTKTIST
jgi:HAD superfamily hydrolase (TIGR01509 family)